MDKNMSFDSSRFTFNPLNDFLGVVMQQGRVQLDADWNEWLAVFARRVQADSMDTMGRAAVPATTPNGFKIKASVDAGGNRHLTIGAGRIYVDGLMAENHGTAAQAQWDPALAEMSGAPAAPPAAAEVDLDYSAQPYLLNASLPNGNGPFLAYLDVWKRPITYLEYPQLIDPAVGIDTTGRVQVAWQVKLLDVSSVAGVSCATPDTSIPQWESLIQPSGSQLTTGVVPSSTSGPCCLNATTGYTGMENQLYRVEIHQGGAANNSGTASPASATFKWSRDNASVITAVTAINPATNVANNPTSQLTVQSTGRDNVLSFRPGDWIEITDDFLELNGLPGELHQIDSNGVNKALKTIVLQTPVSTDLQNRLASGQNYHTRICRWDQSGKVYQSDGATVWVDLGAAGSTGQIPVPPPGTTLILENGVTVTFALNSALGNFHSGDFWTFAARAADGSVEVLAKAPPMGVHHHYARLSIVTFPSDATDCRTIWPPAVSASGECACTVCVNAADHNSGTATIAMAVEKIRSMGGGRICLGPGLFTLGTALQLQGLRSLEISGQGPATALVFAGNGPAIVAENDFGLRIEDLSIAALTGAQANATFAGANAGSGAAVGILLRNCIEATVERCAVLALGPAPAAGTAASAAIGTMSIALDGFLVETQIRDNALVANIGVGQAGQLTIDKTRGLLVVADLSVANNAMLCGTAGAALFNPAAQASTQLNLFLLETALRANRIGGCLVAGIGIAGVTLPDGVIRIADNHINVPGTGIICGADGAEISGNLVTQAMIAVPPPVFNPYVTGGGGPSAIAITSAPGGKLPIAGVRINRNRINNYSGPGILVNGLVLITSITDNSIMLATRVGIGVVGPTVPSEVIVRGNEIFNVVPPPTTGGTGVTGTATTGIASGGLTLARAGFMASAAVTAGGPAGASAAPAAAASSAAASPAGGAAASATPASGAAQPAGTLIAREAPISLAFTNIVNPVVVGIEVARTTTATIENNSVALIGNSPAGTGGAIGIGTRNAAAAVVTGNDISDIGPLTTGGNGSITGISVLADTIGTVNVSNNVIRQTTAGSTQPMPFMGIAIGPNTPPPDPTALGGEAIVKGNMVYGNDAFLVNALAGHSVVDGNLCKLGAELPANPAAATISVTGATCVASNNRVIGGGKLTGLSVSVAGSRDAAKATVLGNIVSTLIQLNGQPLPQPWQPLNLIA
jgi:hypothetical protein